MGRRRRTGPIIPWITQRCARSRQSRSGAFRSIGQACLPNARRSTAAYPGTFPSTSLLLSADVRGIWRWRCCSAGRAPAGAVVGRRSAAARYRTANHSGQRGTASEKRQKVDFDRVRRTTRSWWPCDGFPCDPWHSWWLSSSSSAGAEQDTPDGQRNGPVSNMFHRVGPIFRIDVTQRGRKNPYFRGVDP
jgi:hypothetical protein